jgi:hypothetical protein
MNQRNFIRHVQSTVFDLRLVEYEDVVQLVSNMNIYQDYWEIQQDMFEHQPDTVQRQYIQVQNDELLKDFQ